MTEQIQEIPRPFRRWLKVILGFAVIFLIVMVMVAGSVLFGLSTQWGRSQLAAMVSESEAMSIDAIQGNLFGEFKVIGVSLTDPEGPWLTIPEISVSWAPSALLSRTADIQDIQVPQINVLRAPIAKEEETVSEPFNIADITSQPVSVELRNLEAKSISWLGALEGEQRVTLAATGTLNRNTDLELAVALAPLTDGIEDEINADIVLNTVEASAETKVTLEASADGLITSLTGLPGATQARIEGKGTSGDWSGLIKAAIDGTSVANLTAAYQTPNGQGSGSLFLQPFVNPDDLDLFDTPIALETRFNRISGDKFALDTAITSEAIQSTMDGSLTFVDRRFGAEDIRLKTSLNGRVGAVILSAVETQLVLNGDLSEIVVDAVITADTIASGSAQIKGVTADAVISQSPGSTTAEVTGTLGSVSGVEAIDARILQNITFDAQASARDEDSARFTAEAAASNDYFSVAADDVEQNAAGALSASFEAAVKTLSAFPGAIDATATFKGKASQTANGTTNIKLNGAVRPAKGTAHWIGRFAQEVLTLNTAARLTDDTVTVSALSLKSDRTNVTGKASLTRDAIEASLSGRIDSKAFNDLAPGASAEPATFDITAQGPLATVMPRGDISLPGFTAGGVIFRDIALQLAAPEKASSGGVAVLLSGRSSAGPVRGTANIERFADGLITIADADTRIANLIGTADLQFGGEALGPDGTMTIGLTPVSYAQSGVFGLSGNINLDVTLTSGEDAALTFEGGGPRLAYGPNGDPAAQMRQIAVNGTVDLANEAVSVVAEISAKGVETAGLFFDDVTLNARQDGDSQMANLTIVQNSDQPTIAVLDMTLTPHQNAARIQITPSGILAGEAFGSNMPLDILLTPDGMQLSPVKLTIGGGQLGISATQSAAALQTDISLKDFQLRTLTDLLQQPAYYGVLNADAQLDARASTGTLDATYSVSGLATTADSKLAIGMDGTLAAGPNSLQTQLTAAHKGETQELVASATLPISWLQTPSFFLVEEDAPMQGSLALNTRLAPWWQLADMVDQDLTGLLTGNIVLGGTLADLKPSGALQVREARYETLEYGTQIEGLDADIALTQERITLDSLTASDGRGGTLEAQAAASLFPFLPQDSQILLNDFQLVAKDGLSARADADLKLVSANERLGLQGDITIAEARYAISTTGAASVPTLPIEEINKAALDGFDSDTQIVDAQLAENNTQAATAFDLDLKVTAGRRIFVTGMGLSSEWMTNLDITGTSQVPLVDGQIELVRGELEFAGKRFALERGQIYLDGEAEIDPRLDILAQNTQADFTANIGITGTVSDPDIALSSTPALPDDEILSRILFGTSATDLSALEAVQLGSALAALSSGGGTSALDIAGKARSATGLDRLSLGSNDSSTAITGGKYLSPDVYLQFTTDPGTGQYLAALEWYVTRTLSLLSEYGANTGSNVAARWSRTY